MVLLISVTFVPILVAASVSQNGTLMGTRCGVTNVKMPTVVQSAIHFLWAVIQDALNVKNYFVTVVSSGIIQVIKDMLYVGGALLRKYTTADVARAKEH